MNDVVRDFVVNLPSCRHRTQSDWLLQCNLRIMVNRYRDQTKNGFDCTTYLCTVRGFFFSDQGLSETFSLYSYREFRGTKLRRHSSTFFCLLMQQRCTLGAAVSGAQTAFVTLNLIDYSLEHSLDHLLPGQLKPSAKLMQWIHLFDLNLRS